MISARRRAINISRETATGEQSEADVKYATSYGINLSLNYKFQP